jgi:hypothetical protein
MILSFRQCFVPAVVAGTKPHTIRAGRRWRKGMSIQFYQDARQKTMLKFRPDAVATAVQEITMKHGFRVQKDDLQWPIITIDGRALAPHEMQQLAQRDGFPHCEALAKFIDNAHGLPFTGQLIHWTDLRY